MEWKGGEVVILQALNRYYERLREGEEPQVPALGFFRRSVHFAVVISKDGTLLQMIDLRQPAKPKSIPRQMVVPGLGMKKAAGINPDFLWGAVSYVLGFEPGEKPDRTTEKNRQFKEFQCQLGGHLNDEGVKAVLTFLEKWRPGDADSRPDFAELAGTNVVFQLDGRLQFVHESTETRKVWTEYYQKDNVSGMGNSLISNPTFDSNRHICSVKSL
jgi:CRISPR-associated protein Csd1